MLTTAHHSQSFRIGSIVMCLLVFTVAAMGFPSAALQAVDPSTATGGTTRSPTIPPLNDGPLAVVQRGAPARTSPQVEMQVVAQTKDDTAPEGDSSARNRGPANTTGPAAGAIRARTDAVGEVPVDDAASAEPTNDSDMDNAGSRRAPAASPKSNSSRGKTPPTFKPETKSEVTAHKADTAADQKATKPAAAVAPVTIRGCRVKYLEQATVASERPGIVATIGPREGDRVLTGDRLVQLRDDVTRAQLATITLQANSDVKIRGARKAQQVAAAEYEIALEAIREKPRSVPKTELNKLQLASEKGLLDIEEATLENDFAKLKKKETEAELRTFLIAAPFDGFVVKVLKSRGEAVQQGDPILELVNPARLKVEGYVPLDIAEQLKPGMPVEAIRTANDAVPNEAELARGVLVFVDVGVEPVSGQVRVWAEVEGSSGILRAGVPATLLVSLAPQSTTDRQAPATVPVARQDTPTAVIELSSDDSQPSSVPETSAARDNGVPTAGPVAEPLPRVQPQPRTANSRGSALR